MARGDGQIIDKNFEKEITASAKEAHQYAREKQSQFEEMVSERPFEFVIGAFVGGLLIGALLSKKG